MTTSLRVSLIALAACKAPGGQQPGTDASHQPPDACEVGVCTLQGTTVWADAPSPAGDGTVEHVRFDATGHGWLAASDDAKGAYYTGDGGATWDYRKPGVTAFDVAAVDDAAWLVAAETPTVWSSSDGGAHFMPISGINDFLGTIAFWDPTHGLIGSKTGDRIWITLDGGTTWQQHTFGRDVFPGISDLVVHGGDAWAVGGPSYTPDGTGATIGHSTDQGATWTITQLTDKAHDYKGGTLKAIYVASATELWAAGMNRQLYHSVDGGASWMQLSDLPGSILDFGGITGNGAHLVAAATMRDGGIGAFESVDSGATWQLTMHDACAPLCDVRGATFAGSAIWIWGYAGTLVRGQ